MLFLFQGSLAHSKHIISHVMCIPETRDTVHSWLLGSLFLSEELCSESLLWGEMQNTAWRMAINNSDCVIYEISCYTFFFFLEPLNTK